MKVQEAGITWQTNRSLNNMQLFKEIENSGSLYPYFDYAHGYGIPQADYFITKNKQLLNPTFKILESNDSISVVVNNLVKGNASGLENSGLQAPTERSAYAFGSQYLYYNIMNTSGVLDSYYVVDVTQPEVYIASRKNFKHGETLNIHYAGYSLSVKL